MLSQVQSVRYLGVLNDSTLSWNLHISNMILELDQGLLQLLGLGPYHLLCFVF